jgi:hypothetical protein
MKLKICVSLCVLLLVATSAEAQVKGEKITEAEATQIAEAFISEKDYVNLPLNERTIRKVLLPKAFYIFRGKKGDRQGWTAVFRLKHTCPECDQSSIWRAVTMNEFGNDVRMARGFYRFKR